MKNTNENYNLIANDIEIFLKYLKAKYPMFHNSNFFFRELQFGVQRYLKMKNIEVPNSEAEEIAFHLAKLLEQEGIFLRIYDNGWKINYPDFVTTAPGDPF